MSEYLNPNELLILGQTAVAMLLGALIGVTRELANKPAGLRTHMLVSGAAALLVGLSNVLVNQFESVLTNSIIRADPIRVIEAVITGVSFIGAGTIIRRGSDNGVEGVTTAASLLFAAVIGICVALSKIIVAVGAAVLTIVVVWGIRRVEGWLKPVGQKKETQIGKKRN